MLRSAARWAILPFLLLAAVLLPARAQTNQVEPYYAATTRAEVPLKSGDMDGYYPVAMLPAGQVLWIDAEGAGWARVAYPPGLSVFVRADQVQESDDGKVVVLTRTSALLSKNASAGFAQSWQRAVPLHEEPAAGTRLPVIRVVRGPDGSTIGYEVVPPASVRGYVKAEALRAATEAEVQAYLAAAPRPAMEETPGVVPEDEPVLTPVQEPVADPVEERTEGQAPDGGSLLEPMTPPGETTPEVPPTPGADQPSAERPASDEATVQIRQGESPESRMVGTLRHLAELFGTVQSQDSDTAELDELAAEFRRAISAQGDDAIGQRIRTGLTQRLALVEARIEARDLRRDLRARREAIAAAYTGVGSRVLELERTRGYQFVGRLVRSSVYDGVRLPLMYRMVSVNESVPRTIGYLVPEESLDVTGKLGEIVGVLGTSALDRALNLRIVTPIRVDVLAPEGLGLPSGSAAPAGTLAEQPGS